MGKYLAQDHPSNWAGYPGLNPEALISSTQVLVMQRMGEQGAWAPKGRETANSLVWPEKEPERGGEDGEAGFIPRGQEPSTLKQVGNIATRKQ